MVNWEEVMILSKHYFIGIKIPARIAEALETARSSWDLNSHKRYTPAVDMHITLVFIGGDPNNEIEGVRKALGNIAQAPFGLRISGVESFGKPSMPRVIYAALEESAELQQLHEQVKEILSLFSLRTDNKAYIPHITLANKWAGEEPIDQEMPLEPMQFTAAEFSLFQIEPDRIPRYLPVQTYQLKDDGE